MSNGRVRFMANMYLDVDCPDGIVRNQFFGFGELHRVDKVGICADGYANLYFKDKRVVKGVQRDLLELHKNPLVFDDDDDEQQEPEIAEAPETDEAIETNLQQRRVDEVIDSLEEAAEHPEIEIEGLDDDEEE